MTARFLPSPNDLLGIPYPNPISARSPDEIEWRTDFIIDIGARDARAPELTIAEMAQMEALGFRFSSLNRATGAFRLTLPFATRHCLDRGTLTFLQ